VRVTEEELNQLYSEGDRVRVVVLDVDVDNKRLSLGMKQSYFEEEEEEEEEDEAVQAAEGMDVDSAEEDDAEGAASDEDEAAEAADNDAAMSEDAEDAEVGQPAAPKTGAPVAAAANGRPLQPLSVAVDFDWAAPGGAGGASRHDDAGIESPDEDSDDDDEGDSASARGAGAVARARAWRAGGRAVTHSESQTNRGGGRVTADAAAVKKLSKRAKRRSKEEAEARIAEQENALLAAADAPQSADDYERLLVGTCSTEEDAGGGEPRVKLCSVFRRPKCIVCSVAQLVVPVGQVHGVPAGPHRDRQGPRRR